MVRLLARRSRTTTVIATMGLALVMLAAGRAAARDDSAVDDAGPAVARGVSFLLAQQDGDGAWSGHVGITAVVLMALIPPSPTSPPLIDAIGRGLTYLERWARADGGIYQEDVKHYSTAVAILALAARADPRLQHRIAAARDYLLALQAREETGFQANHALYGGTLVDAGKANLDATFFAARALRAANLPSDHPYWARALRFVSRCQNWKPTNDQAWAKSDGGFVFAPGFSFAGGTTSYGTMTYAGLSIYRDAGLERRDPRVEAAFRWLASNFTARENPGLGKQTLYHSYFYLAHAMSGWGVETFVDVSGRPRSWRRELIQALASLQRADGSWANTDDPRWWESNPVLATALAVRALKEANAPTLAPASSQAGGSKTQHEERRRE
jgi:hypothetical protein